MLGGVHGKKVQGSRNANFVPLGSYTKRVIHRGKLRKFDQRRCTWETREVEVYLFAEGLVWLNEGTLFSRGFGPLFFAVCPI